MKRVILLALAIGFSLFATTSNAALINARGLSGGNINYTVDAGSGFLSTGDFVTLYDAAGTPINLSGDIASSSLFTLTTNFTDTPAPLTAPFDSPTITNLRFTYIGTADLADALLGSFSLADPAGTFRTVSEDGAYHLSAGPSGQAGQASSERVPGFAAPTPEPSSLALLGTGILGLAGVARRKFSR